MPERLAHPGFVEFRAGRWGLAERLVEEACTAIAQLERPGRGRRSSASAPSSTLDAGGPTCSYDAQPLIDEANRSGRIVWEALFLSTLAFVEFAEE